MSVKFAVILYAFLSSAWMGICLAGKDNDVVKMSDDLLQKLLDDNNFVTAIYWAVNDDKVLAVEKCVPGEWCDVSKEYTFAKDVGQPGRVWKSKNYEYNENVQKLDPEKFLRQPVAVDVGVKGLLCIAHTENGEFQGVVELGLKKAKPVKKKILKALKKQLKN